MSNGTRHSLHTILANYFRDFVVSVRVSEPVNGSDGRALSVVLASGRSVIVDIGETDELEGALARVAPGPAANS